jgi:hypothetical protein
VSAVALQQARDDLKALARKLHELTANYGALRDRVEVQCREIVTRITVLESAVGNNAESMSEQCPS